VASSTARIGVVVIVTAIVVAWVAFACDHCGAGARHFLRQLARAIR
jgi:hypothetical protein